MLVVVVVIATNGLAASRLTDLLLRPTYEHPNDPLRDRTGGQHMQYVFDILDATYQPDAPYFFIVGDSTVAHAMPKPGANLPFQWQRALRRAGLPSAKVVDLSHIGLHAEDALVLAAEALAYAPALVVYAVNPRIFNTKDGGAMLTADRAASLAGSVGSLRYLPLVYLVRRYGLEEVAASFSTSHLVIARFAPRIRELLWEYCQEARPGRPLAYLCEKLVRPPVVQPPVQPPAVVRPYVFDRAQIAFDDANARAFEMLVALCEETGRCLFYETPLNPACPVQFEPGIVEDAKAYVARVVAGRVPLIDLSHAAGPEAFLPGVYRECDGLHLDEHGSDLLAGRLAAEAIRALAARSSGLGASPPSPSAGGRS
ncbi:MAG: hypothetical protein IT294_05105 [Deltaproteobacteria bacterium]|nr:hypothetical protein [Deltaproteobacteria bacterium]